MIVKALFYEFCFSIIWNGYGIKNGCPGYAAALYFFTRYVKQAGYPAEPSAVPWRAEHGGMTSEHLAQVPF